MSDAHSVIAEAAEQMYRLNQQIKEFTEQRDQIAAFFKDYEEFKQPGTYKFGRFKLTVSKNQRIDEKLAKELLTPDQYLSILSVKVDSTKAKKNLTGDQYDMIQKKYAHRIGVELEP